MKKRAPDRTNRKTNDLQQPAGSKPKPKLKAKRIVKQDVETTPAQEWGERIATGKAIARGGKTTGHVPGATEQEP
jgi:hypothetical protein